MRLSISDLGFLMIHEWTLLPWTNKTLLSGLKVGFKIIKSISSAHTLTDSDSYVF